MSKFKEHAKLYDTAYDKKEFLKSVSVHEQKIILMNSSKPYEVLNYLDELDLKSSRLLLEELNYDLLQCDYPHTEEEILEPQELIAQFKQKREAYNAELENTLAKILELLNEDN